MVDKQIGICLFIPLFIRRFLKRTDEHISSIKYYPMNTNNSNKNSKSDMKKRNSYSTNESHHIKPIKPTVTIMKEETRFWSRKYDNGDVSTKMGRDISKENDDSMAGAGMRYYPHFYSDNDEHVQKRQILVNEHLLFSPAPLQRILNPEKGSKEFGKPSEEIYQIQNDFNSSAKVENSAQNPTGNIHFKQNVEPCTCRADCHCHPKTFTVCANITAYCLEHMSLDFDFDGQQGVKCMPNNKLPKLAVSEVPPRPIKDNTIDDTYTEDRIGAPVTVKGSGTKSTVVVEVRGLPTTRSSTFDTQMATINEKPQHLQLVKDDNGKSYRAITTNLDDKNGSVIEIKILSNMSSESVLQSTESTNIIDPIEERFERPLLTLKVDVSIDELNYEHLNAKKQPLKQRITGQPTAASNHSQIVTNTSKTRYDDKTNSKARRNIVKKVSTETEDSVVLKVESVQTDSEMSLGVRVQFIVSNENESVNKVVVKLTDSSDIAEKVPTNTYDAVPKGSTELTKSGVNKDLMPAYNETANVSVVTLDDTVGIHVGYESDQGSVSIDMTLKRGRRSKDVPLTEEEKRIIDSIMDRILRDIVSELINESISLSKHNDKSKYGRSDKATSKGRLSRTNHTDYNLEKEKRQCLGISTIHDKTKPCFEKDPQYNATCYEPYSHKEKYNLLYPNCQNQITNPSWGSTKDNFLDPFCEPRLLNDKPVNKERFTSSENIVNTIINQPCSDIPTIPTIATEKKSEKIVHINQNDRRPQVPSSLENGIPTPYGYRKELVYDDLHNPKIRLKPKIDDINEKSNQIKPDQRLMIPSDGIRACDIDTMKFDRINCKSCHNPINFANRDQHVANCLNKNLNNDSNNNNNNILNNSYNDLMQILVEIN